MEDGGNNLFKQTVQEIKARNADTDPEELQSIIDEAVDEVRAEKPANRLAAK